MPDTFTPPAGIYVKSYATTFGYRPGYTTRTYECRTCTAPPHYSCDTSLIPAFLDGYHATRLEDARLGPPEGGLS